MGNLTQKRLPSGEEYRFQHSSKGSLEKSTFPDGTYEITGTDRNGRVTRRVDRRLLEVSARYNKADQLVENLASDATYGLISRVSTHTHLGPAAVTESEGGVQKVASSREYHWSGAPSKVTQTVDSLTLNVDYTYDAGGTLISVTPTGSGASPWSQKFNLKPQYHPSTPDTDPFNRTAIEKDGAAHVITRESDYLGLSKRIKYGDYASTKGEVALGYDKFLRLTSIQSNEGGTPALDISLVRDFGGNILSKEGESFAYDGMNRLVDDDGEPTSYDEISNLSARGARRYSYQSAGEGAQSQMRLSSFDDGSSTWDYSYDNNGNITSISSRFDSLVYDVMNRLREVHWHGSARVDSYWYDGAGLRVKKDENGTKTYSLYAGENPLVQEVYSGSTRVLTRLNIVDGGQILARYEYVYGTGENVKYFYLDQIGSRRVVKDSTGAVTDKFTYSAWGEATQTQGTAADLASYTGKDYDGTALLYFNARYYDPAIGRFLTEDPSMKGSAWYTYCSNNPLNRTDPTGMYDPDDPSRHYSPSSPQSPPAPTAAAPATQPGPPGSPPYPSSSGQPSATPNSTDTRRPETSRPLDYTLGQWPTESRNVTSVLGPAHPSGIDIGALTQGVAGDLITASAGGTVTTAGFPSWSHSGASYVVIQGEQGMEYRYAHMGQISVAVGDVVTQGQQLGTMGDVGAPGQVHLHFEVLQYGRRQDPLPMLR